MRKLFNVTGASILALGLSLGAVTAAQAEMVLHRGNGAEFESLDVHKSTDIPSSNLQADVFEGLMTYGQDGKPVPGVAESYTVSDDGLVYTFKFREDAKWSDGTPVTAEDFVFSWERLLNPKHAFDYAYFLWPVKNAEAYGKGEITDFSQVGVKALDDRTLEVTLRSPTPYFVSSLPHHSTWAISKANYEKFGEDFIKPGNLVSNGAYVLAEHVPQSHAKLVKNPHYHGAEDVKIDTVYYYPTEDRDAELKRYRAGELDIAEEVPSQQIPWVKENLGSEYREYPYFGTYSYVVNMTHEPWASNKDLRKALALALDRDILIEKITQGGEIPAYTWVPPGTSNYPGYTVDYAGWTQEQRDQLAKELIAKAGYADKPLQVEIMYNTSENHKKVAIAMANMWKQKLGIESTLNNQEWKVFLETRDKKEYKDLARYGWIGDYDDANNFLELFRSDIGDSNPAGYNNPQFDELMQKAAVTADLDERGKLMQQAEQILIEDAAVIPIYFYSSNHLVKPHVVGWVDNTQDKHLTKYMSVNR